MTTLRRHPQGAGHAVGPTPGTTLEDLAAAAAMLRAQTQPAHEILLVRKSTQVNAQFAQDHQRRRLADALDLRQIHPRHPEEQGAGAEANLVLLRLALTQARRQRPSVALVLHAPQTRCDLRLAVPQLLLIELVKLERLLQAEQQLLAPVAVQRRGNLGLGPLAALVAIFGQLQGIALATHN